MNIATIRLSCWLFSMSLTFGLSYYGYEFYQGLERTRLPADEHVRDALGETFAVAPLQAACIALPEVHRTWWDYNWTGELPPPPRTGGTVTPSGPQFVSVLSMLRMTMVQVDGAADAKDSCIYVYYVDPRVAPGSADCLHIGDALPAPFSGTSIVSISQQGVEFAHAEFPQRNEVIRPGDTAEVPLIFVVGPDGARIEERPSILLGRPTVLRPKQTVMRGKDHFQMGTEDAANLAENYPEILTSDVRYRTHRDAKTGKRRGIEIQEVRAGSVAERHGLRGGDIILSVNDQMVTGVQGAISYFKTNADRFTTWEVVLENMGRRRTVTYESPAQ